MRILTLNCQKNIHNSLENFLKQVLRKKKYDILLLQEATADVLEMVEKYSQYKIISNTYSKNRISLVSIVYISHLTLEDQIFEPLVHPMFEDHEKKKPFQTFGFLGATFSDGEERITAGSVHLFSGLSAKRRKKAIQELSEKLSERIKDTLCVFGGDCNFSLPGEHKRTAKSIDTTFRCVTENIGSTLDSKYTEPNPLFYWVRMNELLKKLNISIKLRTDHFFIDRKSLAELNYSVRKLPDRVSDHSPIELIISR